MNPCKPICDCFRIVGTKNKHINCSLHIAAKKGGGRGKGNDYQEKPPSNTPVVGLLALSEAEGDSPVVSQKT